MKDVELYEEVIIKATNEHAYIVWISSDDNVDSYLLEIIDKDEMPNFYVRNDFEKIKPLN